MKLGGGQRKPTAKLEIDDANGETLSFPDIGDVSEIVDGVTVTASDGTHVFTADNSVYTIEVAGGKVTKVVEDQTGDPAPGAEAMSPETVEFIEAVAEALEAHETFRVTAQATIDAQAQTIATMQADFVKFKATMGHKSDKDDVLEKGEKKVQIGGKSIDLTKLNLK
jgi:hypothetical protein